jgi:DNA-binding MurR/RpiR family transcriptional regulator
MTQDIISVIREDMSAFSKRQRMIALYITEHYDKAAYMTAARLSREVGVSESTVVRFAAELGYDGYQQFQSALQEFTRTQLTSVQRMEIAKHRIDTENILQSVLESDILNIQKTLQSNCSSDFDKAVLALSGAKSVYVMGIRSASSLALFAGFYLNIMFEHVHIVRMTSASDIFEQIWHVQEGDVFLGITFPRYSTNTVKAANYAKKRGATVISLTDSPHSPLARSSTHCLIARSDMASFVDSIVAPLSVLNALLVAVSAQKREEVSSTLGQLESVWEEYDVYEKHGDSYE